MQAARGASLSDVDDEDKSPADQERPGVGSQGPARRRARSIFVVVALVLLALDQLTKVWAVAALTPGEPRDLVGSLLRLNLIRNPGAAFSTGTSHTALFTVLALVATIVVIWFAFRLQHVGWAVALGFLFAGVVGNLVDRIVREPSVFQGHVVDFLELPHWPIFNVADMCINVAAVLILVLAYRGARLGGGR